MQEASRLITESTEVARGTLPAQEECTRPSPGDSDAFTRHSECDHCSSRCNGLQLTSPGPAEPAGSGPPATLAIPPGHLPPPGLCRVWLPGEPPGHQPPARACASIEVVAPAGSWIVYRPPKHKREVYVRLVDQRRAGMVVGFRVYDIQHGTLIREG